MAGDDYKRFSDLTFDRFRELAQSDQLSRHEKVGFPDSYREGKEQAIIDDICTKLPLRTRKRNLVLDIGPGCSQLPLMLADICAQQEHRLFLIDSTEMLEQIPDRQDVQKIRGRFPAVPAFLGSHAGRIDMILVYSVIQYPFVEGDFWTFFDQALALLNAEGVLLIGDIPNISMRKRFFASESGIRYHREFTGGAENPGVLFNRLEPGSMDDSVVLAMLGRARAAGYHAWVQAQAPALPMANRREDILICRP